MKPIALSKALTYMISMDIPVMIWGPPGCGKSDIVGQTANTLGYEILDLRLVLKDPIDMKGIPVRNDKKKVMEWWHDGTLPTKGKGIIFLDELPSAPPAVQAAAYQLVLDRRIGEYTLPSGWRIIGAGNRLEDRGVVHRMPSPLANRFTHLTLETGVDDWCLWAGSNKVSADTIGFIRMRPELLHKMDISDNPLAFPTQRSWVRADMIMQNVEEAVLSVEMISGTVGEGPAAEYFAYRKYLKDLPTADEITLNPEKAPVPEEPAALYAVMSALELRTSANNFDRLMKYVERCPTEFQVLYVRAANIRDEGCGDTEAFLKWSINNGAVLV